MNSQQAARRHRSHCGRQLERNVGAAYSSHAGARLRADHFQLYLTSVDDGAARRQCHGARVHLHRPSRTRLHLAHAHCFRFRPRECVRRDIPSGVPTPDPGARETVSVITLARCRGG